MALNSVNDMIMYSKLLSLLAKIGVTSSDLTVSYDEFVWIMSGVKDQVHEDYDE